MAGQVSPDAITLPRQRSRGRTAGVSVVIPSFRGRDHIGQCLRSLAAQTLAPHLFEIVVVLNGEPDGTRGVLADFTRAHPELTVKVIELPTAGTSHARNVGIDAATREHLTFIDDDDTVSPAYLKTLLAHAGPGVVPFAQIVNVDDAGRIDVATTINTQAIRHTGRVVHPSEVPRAVGFNACKLVPAQMIRDIRYDTGLHSGVDVVFFMTLLARHDFDLYVCPVGNGPDAENAVYYRRLRPNSMSRRAVSFEFNIVGRMEVISRLDALLAQCPDQRRRRVIRITMNSQLGFMNRYLRAHPDELDRVLRTIGSYQVSDFPYARLTRGLARSLVISYCFAPYSATSGIVMAKRIRERGEIVDVVYNAMDSARDVDHSTLKIAEGLIDQDLRLNAPNRFARWSTVEEFCTQGLARLAECAADGKPPYQRMYSRVTWPASHFLAAVYKGRNPRTWWSAEYSDPVSRGVDGKERTMPVTDGPLLDELRHHLRSAGLPVPATDNGFRWCEHLGFALADEVVFTNGNQRDYMLSHLDDDDSAELVRRVRAKAVVRAQPTLPPQFYSLVDSGYPLADGAVHLAYFGAFYATRGIDDVLTAIAQLHRELRDRVRLHIFTNSAPVLARVKELRISGSVVIQRYVPYLEFLNLTTRFDWLIVNDAVTRTSHDVNPYLPSKWSDYRGSGTPVWGLVEDGSPLSQQPLDHRSPAGDPAAARAFLESVVTARFGSPPPGRRRRHLWPFPARRYDAAQADMHRSHKHVTS